MLFKASYLMEDNEEYVYIINTDTPKMAKHYMIEELIKIFGSIDNTTQGEITVEILPLSIGVLTSFWLKPDN